MTYHFCSSHFCEVAVCTGLYWMVLIWLCSLMYQWLPAWGGSASEDRLAVSWSDSWWLCLILGSWVPRVQPKKQAFAKSLLALSLLLFYWPKLVIGWSPESMWKKIIQRKRYRATWIFFILVIEQILVWEIEVIYQRKKMVHPKARKKKIKNERYLHTSNVAGNQV